MNKTNYLITEYKNGLGSVKLTKLANVFMVSFTPRYGESAVNSHDFRKSAEKDFSHYANILMNGERT